MARPRPPRRPGPGGASARGRRARAATSGSGSGMQDARRRRRTRRSGTAGRAAPSRRAGAVAAALGGAEKSGARNGLASWRAMTDCGTTRRSAAPRRPGSSARGSAPRAPARRRRPRACRGAAPGRVGDDGILGEQREQGGVAGGGLGEDRRDAVEPLELSASLGLGQLGVGLTRARSSRTSRATTWNLVARRTASGAALDGGLDLADRARQDGDDALVVLVAGVRRGAAAAALTLALGQGGPPGLGYASWNRRARVGSACTHGVEVWSGRQVRGGRRIGGDHSGTASGTLPPL